MPQRLLIILAAVAIGGLFATGLFVDGPLGGVLLLATDLILIGLTRTAWAQVRPNGKPMRLVIIAAIAALAMVKLVHG